MNWTEQQVADYNAGRGKSAPVSPKPKQPRSGYRSKTEAAYAQHLDLMLKSGLILSWKYEAVTLKLADGVRYTPDFIICGPLRDQIRFHEIKGRKNQSYWSRDVGKVKIRVAATLFPWWEFSVVWPGERLGTWDTLPVGKGNYGF